jgi:hypothetical protein
MWIRRALLRPFFTLQAFLCRKQSHFNRSSGIALTEIATAISGIDHVITEQVERTRDILNRLEQIERELDVLRAHALPPESSAEETAGSRREFDPT